MRVINCYLCGCWIDFREVICSSCYKLLPRNENACLICALPLTSLYCEDHICQKCCLQRFPVDIVAPFIYKYPINNMIHSFKYNFNMELVAFFSDEIFKVIVGASKVDVVVPVPLHYSRIRYRGFNQSAELVKSLACKLNIPAKYDACHRVVNTKAQALCDRITRLVNMDMVFEVSENVEGKSILIIDDVVTTGATVISLAKSFFTAGATRVKVVAIARG